MKNKFLYWIAVISYYIGIISLFYFLNRKSKRIITFHNVIPQDLLPNGKRIGLVDTEEEFKTKIEEISKRFLFSVDLTDSSSVTITFDDGYVNQFEVAGCILAEKKIPAIIFASGKIIGNVSPHNALVVDLLMHWVELAPNGFYKLNINSLSEQSFELKSDNRKFVWEKIIWPAFNNAPETKGENVLGELQRQYAIENVLKTCHREYLRLRLTGLSNEDMDFLIRKGWDIGWHTCNHYPLSKLSYEDIKQEIDGAPLFMHKVVMSYPYGEVFSVNEECLNVVQESGFPCAVSNMPDKVGFTGKYFMPRYTLPLNRYLLHFELSGLKNFIKTGHLLPIINF